MASSLRDASSQGLGKGGSRSECFWGAGLRERWAAWGLSDTGTSVPVGEGHGPLSPGGLTWPAWATCPSDATLFRLFLAPTVGRTVLRSWECLSLFAIRPPLRIPASCLLRVRGSGVGARASVRRAEFRAR